MGEEMNSDFEMAVVECWTITRWGTYVSGPWSGCLPAKGVMLSLERSGQVTTTQCRGVEALRKLDEAGAPVLDAVAIGVDIEKFVPSPGDKITTVQRGKAWSVMPRWMLYPLAAVALWGCTVSGERRMVAQKFMLPRGYELVNRYEHRGEVGKIGGGPVGILVAKPVAAISGDVAASVLCGELAGGSTVQHPPHEVPADWDTCSFEQREQRVLVGTYARFRGYSEVLADDACGPNRCEDDGLVVWIE